MNKSILLVEDDSSLGFLLKDALQQYGYLVTWSNNGADGIRTFHQHHFDLCLLDIMLPAIDGFTLAELIREKNKSVPILFLSARSMTKDVLRGFDIGADDYIRKPVSEKELIARIEAVFRRANQMPSQPHNAIFSIGYYQFG